MARALASEAPDRPSLTDDIAYFEARLATRGEERFSRRRLAASHLLRFRAYGDRADLEAASRQLEALGAGGALEPERLATEASLHLTRHEFRAARESAASAIEAAGLHDATLQLRLFDVLWASGAYDEAARRLGVPHDTASLDFLAREARLLDRLGRVGEARDNLRLVLGKVRAFAEPPPVEAWALVELAHLERHAGDPHRAVALFLEALAVLPGSPAALEGLASVARGVDRNHRAAVALYRHALANGGHPDILAAWADVEDERGAPERARALREELLRQAEGDPQVLRWALRPLALALAGDPSTACRALGFARRDLIERQDAGAWDALAWTLYRTGEVDAAYRASREATGWGVPEPAVAYRAGVIADEAGHHDRAEALLRDALAGRSELAASEVRDAERRLAGSVAPTRLAPPSCD